MVDFSWKQVIQKITWRSGLDLETHPIVFCRICEPKRPKRDGPPDPDALYGVLDEAASFDESTWPHITSARSSP